jgi:phosphoglycerate dehydrogenase-like enzyme
MHELNQCRVLVTATSFGKDDPSLRTQLEAKVKQVIYNPYGRPLTSNELQALLPGVDGLIAGLDQIDRAAIECGDRLKIIARYGVGCDRVDLNSAKEHRITVTNTPGANAVAVAELTIGLMLSLARDIPNSSRATKAGSWPRLSGIALQGKTIGLLGLGSVGKAVARRLRAFDCHILAFDPLPQGDFARRVGIEMSTQEAILREADFLSLHLPATTETRNTVDKDFLSKMKHGAFLINTARGELVDEAALFEALQSGQLRGAALDAFQQEPPDPANPLLGMEQVIVTPHAGSHADSATRAMGTMATEDCLAVLQGDKPQYPVTRSDS